jgi:hypothetical protein
VSRRETFMNPSIYIINPRSDSPSYYGGEAFAANGFAATVSIADLATPTVAGLAPGDFDITLCDENCTAIAVDAHPDYVAVTGKVSQSARMKEIATLFRSRGTTVLIGGPYASLDPDNVRPYCDILVRGELEGIADELFSDLRSGHWKTEYYGGRPDLSLCRTPRWDLYPNMNTLVATVQTSRGCPFECEFCDVIEYLGRRQRHKPIGQVLTELDTVYAHGYREVFLADDNLTVYRSRAKELLTALAAWNHSQREGHVRFYTQISIDAAKDEELLTLCAAAGLRGVFIGLETGNTASLKEAKKRQNLNIDVVDRVNRIVRHGIAVTGGMIVGFDSDHPNIFESQYGFGMSLPVPVYTLGALVAPAATPLYFRIQREGRLIAGGQTGVQAAPWHTNIQPKNMTREELVGGLRKLCRRLYDPIAFGERLGMFIREFGTHSTHPAELSLTRLSRNVGFRAMDLLQTLRQMGPLERLMWDDVSAALCAKPEARAPVAYMLLQYVQIRYMYATGAFWELAPQR